MLHSLTIYESSYTPETGRAIGSRRGLDDETPEPLGFRGEAVEAP
jgi:hypothetical protein